MVDLLDVGDLDVRVCYVKLFCLKFVMLVVVWFVFLLVVVGFLVLVWFLGYF